VATFLFLLLQESMVYHNP